MDPLAVVGTAIWVMLPAYVPNNAAVLVGGGPPIDGGRTWGERRLLGDGKSWRGLAGGLLAGVAVALGLNALYGPIGGWLLAASFPPGAVLGLPLGALLGDIVASFVKRRTGRPRGAPFPGVDQLDFVVGALAVALVFATGWTLATFSLPILVVVLVLTPVLHVGSNLIAFWLGLKDEPW
jgi:CDP-2,3-bis-(O-geranylgeranyl)-sn-glycerol synthase